MIESIYGERLHTYLMNILGIKSNIPEIMHKWKWLKDFKRPQVDGLNGGFHMSVVG